jgi:hydrogenase expression/formation protein HypE
MAVSTDPIWIERSYGLANAAWFAFHTIVGDVALSGLKPSHLALDWNLPQSLTAADALTMMRVFGLEAKKLGMTVVTGHTGVYDGASLPTIGGGTAFAVGRRKDVILPSGSTPGDLVVITKGPAVETAVYLCYRYRRSMEKLIGPGSVERIRHLLHSMSVVGDAIIASAVRGVTAMHDASERGIAAAMNEMSVLSGCGFELCSEEMYLHPSVEELTESLSLDPLSCSSEGTLLITVRPESAHRLVDGLRKKGIVSHEAGIVTLGGGVKLTGKGRSSRLRPPSRDHLLDAIEKLSGSH